LLGPDEIKEHSKVQHPLLLLPGVHVGKVHQIKIEFAGNKVVPLEIPFLLFVMS
jgi:hypothetical protein